MPHNAYIALGSNLDDRAAMLAEALVRLQSECALAPITCSPWYETAPVGGPEQPPYLNAVVHVLTAHPPHLLLQTMLHIEASLGRVRGEHWGPRCIDLDLLLHDDAIIASEGPPALALPHPLMHLRRFVLQPLADIAPGLLHPAHKKTITALLEACPDRGLVVAYPATNL